MRDRTKEKQFGNYISVLRRKHGFQLSQVSEGLCTEQMLFYLEKGKRTAPKLLQDALLERLGVGAEDYEHYLHYKEYDRWEARQHILYCIAYEMIEEAVQLLEQYRMIPCNRQVLERVEIILKRKSGRLDDTEYFREMRGILELTLSYKAFLKEGEKYLTYEEQCCIQNMMQVMDKTSEEYLICMERFEEIYQPYESNFLIGTVNSIYELIMESVGSEWGNLGDYDRADKYSRIIVAECLRFRRLHAIAAGLYDRWWNYMERKRREIPVDKIVNGEEELTKCLVFSILDKQIYYEPFYRKKLEQVLGEE